MPKSKVVDAIKVRMYRQGFGDCFLLSFSSGNQRVFTMLIDCGIKYNTNRAEVPIEDVIADLTEVLTPEGGGQPELDVLVASHEHWDHIAFFHPDRFHDDLFSRFDIKQVWLAWTENPRDKEAKEINSRLRDGVGALTIAAERLGQMEKRNTPTKQIDGKPASIYASDEIHAARSAFNLALDDQMGFYGARSVSESGIKYKKNGRVSTMTEAAMENIVGLGKEPVQYFNPGTMVPDHLLPGGINIYVMGPPRSSLINKSNASRGRAKETYLSIDRFGMSSFVDGLLAVGSKETQGDHLDSASPFGDNAGIPREEAETHDFFKQSYFHSDEEYRRVDECWLDITGQFALQLDNAINNTSLVLAIELAESGKILLFPGDAQVGSWLSWHKHKWQVKKGKEIVQRSAEDLLNNTVLYKFSHHGSHNATLKDLGLEMMIHPELVGMVPEKEDSYSGIPHSELFEQAQDEDSSPTGRAYEMCKGRVMFSADKNFPVEDLLERQPPELTSSEWQAFQDALTVETAYVEYVIRG